MDFSNNVWNTVKQPQFNYATEPNSAYNAQTNQPISGKSFDTNITAQAMPKVPSAIQSDFTMGQKAFGGAYQDAAGNKQSTGGFVSPAMSAIGTGVNAWMGMQGLDMARENLDFQKDSWEKNFAMQQDQYYRSLNNKRSINNSREGMTQAQADQLNQHYDSGSNLEGAYRPGPTVQAAAANSAMVAGAATPEMAASMTGRGSMYPNNGVIGGASGSRFTAPGATPPVTSSDAAIQNTNVGPDGKRRVKRKDDVGSRQVNPDAQ